MEESRFTLWDLPGMSPSTRNTKDQSITFDLFDLIYDEKKCINQRMEPTIMLLRKVGAGKSSFINYIPSFLRRRKVDGSRMKGFTSSLDQSLPEEIRRPDQSPRKGTIRVNPQNFAIDPVTMGSIGNGRAVGGAPMKGFLTSGEKEWMNPPRAANILLRLSASTFVYTRPDVDQIAPGEKKSKSSDEKEWTNPQRTANILIRVLARTFNFSRGDVDKIGSKEKKSKSSNGTEGWGVFQQNPKAKQEYDKITRCSVCLDKDACVLFFPCRHMTTCKGCADVVTDCPLCRLRIKGTVKINVV